jgi:DNA-binding NtrC family response regulator
MLSILIIDNEYSSQTLLTNLLQQHGYKAQGTSNLSESLKQIRNNHYDLILTDLSLHDINAIELLGVVKQINPNIEVIVFAEYGSIESAVESMKLGAFDYMLKPIDSDELIIKVERALSRKRMNEEIEHLQTQFRKEYGLDMIIAESKEMREVLHSVSRIAEGDSPVLIQGESGTGKELVIRAIHSSGRPGKSFIPINCGAMPETLLESELFGYMKGAFTGARFNKKGLFEEAHGGTIFLDEIGDMSHATQVKLLRVLDFGEIRRLGSNLPVYVDTRVVAATNKNIKSLVNIGGFREDLYYRLNVIIINIPPLRERKADIFPLANHFLKIYSNKMDKEVLKLAPETRQLLMKYDWPGNVRELENVIERAIVLAQYDTIFPDDLPSSLQYPQPDIIKQAIKSDWNIERLEREYIVGVLKECSGNLSQTTERLGIARNSLWRKLKKYGVS